MRIAVFSDIHGNLEALEAIIEDIKNENIDDIICLGDVIGLGPSSKECLDLIIDNKIKLVLGNHELCYLFGFNIDYTVTTKEIEHYKYIEASLSDYEKVFLEKCPLSIECKYKDSKFLFSHFLIKDKKLKYPFYSTTLLSVLKDSLNDVIKRSDANYIFIGHEHNSFKVEVDEKKLIDIGSSGCVKNNITNYTIIELGSDIEVMKKVITYNRDKFIATLKEKDYPERKNLAKKFFGIEIE